MCAAIYNPDKRRSSHCVADGPIRKRHCYWNYTKRRHENSEDETDVKVSVTINRIFYHRVCSVIHFYVKTLLS